MMLISSSGSIHNSSGVRKLALAAGAAALAIGSYFVKPETGQMSSCKPQGYSEMKRAAGDKIKKEITAFEPESEGPIKNCKTSYPEKLKAGDKFSFGITQRSMFGIEVSEIHKNYANVNATLSALIPLPGENLVTITFTVKGINVPIMQVETLFRINCGQKQDFEAMSDANFGALYAAEQSVRTAISQATGSRISGEFLLTTLPEDIFKTARVVGETQNDLAMEAGGKKFKLAREATLNLESKSENAGYFQIPILLTSKKTDGKNKLGIIPDCETGRPLYMEIFMSEHATGDMREMYGCPR